VSTLDFDSLLAAAKAAEAARAKAMPTTEDAISIMYSGYQRLLELGWRQAMYAPKGTTVLVIEPGSSGEHEAMRDEEGRFWIAAEGDLWPSIPCLFKAKS
jgi:hypothetical protein